MADVLLALRKYLQDEGHSQVFVRNQPNNPDSNITILDSSQDSNIENDVKRNAFEVLIRHKTRVTAQLNADAVHASLNGVTPDLSSEGITVGYISVLTGPVDLGKDSKKRFEFQIIGAIWRK